VTKYAPYWCEENVWWLAQEPRFAGRRGTVVFVSNETRSVAMYGQRAARRPGEPVGWDYHVVLAVDDREVWDLDCAEGAPLAPAEWLRISFGPGDRLPARFRPRFRLVDAAEYVRTFSSDRSHMRLANGRWRKPPPEWPAIERGPSNLEPLVDMSPRFAGDLVDLEVLRVRWR
jgi:hypothetical protein